MLKSKPPILNGEDDDDLSALTAIAFRILADDRKKVTKSKSQANRPEAKKNNKRTFEFRVIK